MRYENLHNSLFILLIFFLLSLKINQDKFINNSDFITIQTVKVSPTLQPTAKALQCF